jgi:hypothetical protein
MPLNPYPKVNLAAMSLHSVFNQNGQACRSMLWESKRTKNWSDGWLVKLREDQRSAKAEVAILVSHALPKGVETFEVIDGIWVTSPAHHYRSLASFTTRFCKSAWPANPPKANKAKLKWSTNTSPARVSVSV